MLYVSLPVHEKPEVIVNQMQNFARYLPEAKVILHVSKGATFSINDLEALFKKENVQNGLVNPVQIETHWGSIVQAHLENVRYILKQGNAEKVAFHSSNDMLIMDGLSEYLKDKRNIFQLRKCTADSLWWVSRRAVSDKGLSDFFDNNIYASQIEGSMYEIGVLERLLNDIKFNKLNLDSSIFYPREEIIFSSFAYKNNIVADGLPYIYSEIHQFDRALFKCFSFFKLYSRNNHLFKRFFRYSISKILALIVKKNIDKKIIDSICLRDDNIGDKFILNDGVSLTWLAYYKISLFGVKRVKRDINNKIRISISNKYK